MLVHVVADYGPAGDLAFAEVSQRLLAALPAATIVATPVAPFDTLAAGFVVAQLALTDGPSERVVFHNVAPRRDETNARRANEGERFTAAEVPNGTLVVGPNSVHSLAFLHDQAPLFYLDVPAAGSQFRSRDFLPAAVGRLVAGDRSSLGEPVASELVPPVPRGVVAYTDGYGNLKTTLDEPPAANGERVLVRLAEASTTAMSPMAASRSPKASSRSRPARRGGRCPTAGNGAFSSCSCAAEAQRPPWPPRLRHARRRQPDSARPAGRRFLERASGRRR